MASSHETPVAEKNQQSPEERFRELVLIREKEKQIENQLANARKEAEAKIENAKADIEEKRQQVKRDTEREIDSMKQQAIQEAGQEAKELLDQAKQVASGTESKADNNVQKLIEQFKEELLSK